MSAEHSQHAPVRLLIAESSENTAQEFDSMLRDAGIATRMRLVDLAMAADALPTADLMLCNSGLPQLELVLPQLHDKTPDVPIILVNPANTGLSTSDGMRLGAADVVSSEDPEALVLVFKRELARVCQSRRAGELTRALQEAEQRCQLLLQSSMAAIAYVHEGMHIHANAEYLNLFGFSDADELLGLPLMDLMDEASAESLKQALKRLRQGGEEHTLEFCGRATTGVTVTGSLTLAEAEYEGEACLQVTVRAGSPPAAADHHSNGAAAHHEANGSAAPAPPAASVAGGSVAAFIEAARQVLDSPDPHRVVAVAQIDGFKALQEETGLRGAEDVGQQVYDVLKTQLEGRPLARLGPHQYAFAMADADRSGVLDRVDVLRETIEALMLDVGGKTVRARLSIGGAELHSDGDAGEMLERSLNAAFGAASRAEAAGGNRIDVLTSEITRQRPGSEATVILSQINEAIDKQRFVLLFQPIISLRGDADEHYEVFLRMADKDGKHIAPNEFLRTAVENGVAAKIDRWVILQSIKMLSAHRSKGHNTRLTINLTANSITDPEFLQWLGVAIKAARLPSDAVIFQITEEEAAFQVRRAGEFVEGLKAMHCRASLSRFGLIADPMELLDHIPVDYVKLDGSHVERLVTDNAVKDELTAMIRTLQDAGKLTVIPMVESAGVLSALWQAGANYIQGHYLQEPSTEMNFDFSTDD